jgi:hypothetical protein
MFSLLPIPHTFLILLLLSIYCYHYVAYNSYSNADFMNFPDGLLPQALIALAIL